MLIKILSELVKLPIHYPVQSNKRACFGSVNTYGYQTQGFRFLVISAASRRKRANVKIIKTQISFC